MNLPDKSKGKVHYLSVCSKKSKDIPCGKHAHTFARAVSLSPGFLQLSLEKVQGRFCKWDPFLRLSASAIPLNLAIPDLRQEALLSHVSSLRQPPSEMQEEAPHFQSVSQTKSFHLKALTRCWSRRSQLAVAMSSGSAPAVNDQRWRALVLLLLFLMLDSQLGAKSPVAHPGLSDLALDKESKSAWQQPQDLSLEFPQVRSGFDRVSSYRGYQG